VPSSMTYVSAEDEMAVGAAGSGEAGITTPVSLPPSRAFSIRTSWRGLRCSWPSSEDEELRSSEEGLGEGYKPTLTDGEPAFRSRTCGLITLGEAPDEVVGPDGLCRFYDVPAVGGAGP